MKSIQKVQSILAKQNVDAWLLITAENKDPYFRRLISPYTTAPSIALITQREIAVFAHTLDADNLETIDDSIQIFTYEQQSLLESLCVDLLQKMQPLNKIALNYSTMNDVETDVLGHGLYHHYTNLLTKGINRYKELDPFCSAETVIYALFDQKSEADIKKLSIAAKRAHQIILDACKEIKPGMMELDIVAVVHEITKIKPKYFEKQGVIDEDYAWEEATCPIILTGPNLIKGGHALPSNTAIEEGFTVYFDFGVQLTFTDGSKWSSDIQRTAYVLRKEETTPPDEIKKKFNTLVAAVDQGIKSIKPGMKGYEVDQIVRSYILHEGYPDYSHATGHAIGELAHNPGAILSRSKNKLASLEIQPNGVYTIEPRIATHNGVSVEEMVVVYADRPAETLCERQEELILIHP